MLVRCALAFLCEHFPEVPLRFRAIGAGTDHRSSFVRHSLGSEMNRNRCRSRVARRPQRDSRFPIPDSRVRRRLRPDASPRTLPPPLAPTRRPRMPDRAVRRPGRIDRSRDHLGIPSSRSPRTPSARLRVVREIQIGQRDVDRARVRDGQPTNRCRSVSFVSRFTRHRMRSAEFRESLSLGPNIMSDGHHQRFKASCAISCC